MRTAEDIEAYLVRSGHPHKTLDENTWLVTDPSDHRDHIVVRMSDDLVLFRTKVLELNRLKQSEREACLHRLLEFNGSDMIHGAYGIADDSIVLTATFRLQNLDFNEFSGTLDDFAVAISNHVPALRDFVKN